jgi:hypothetical protein
MLSRSHVFTIGESILLDQISGEYSLFLKEGTPCLFTDWHTQPFIVAK